MKAVLLSIQPYYVFLIIARLMGWDIPQEKRIEVRKDFPKASDWNKKVLIYCSKNRRSFKRIPKQYQPFMKKLLGKVVGEFVCDRVDKYVGEFWELNDDPMSKDHSMEQIRQSYYADPDDCECEEEFDYVTGNEVENQDNCDLCRQSCLTYAEIRKYIGEGLNDFYGWHISDLKIYGKPKELGKFTTRRKCTSCKDSGYASSACVYDANCLVPTPLTRPPQSWCYVEEA